jgi:hypothetical protein
VNTGIGFTEAKSSFVSFGVIAADVSGKVFNKVFVFLKEFHCPAWLIVNHR